MNNIEIQIVNFADITLLQSICRQTFIETFANQNSPEDIQIYLNVNLSTAKLKDELNNSNSAFYFAICDNYAVAYLKLNIAQAKIKEKETIEIERIYVIKEFQRRKIGQFLIEFAINTAKEKGMGYIG
jgi:GNAT superfamily N-acetyltransferase